MGKQSRLKAERRAQREQQAPEVEAWSQIPEEATSGLCRKPGCALVHCTDPWVTKLKLTNATYQGILVLVCYSIYPDSTDRKETHLRVNGKEIGLVPTMEMYHADFQSHRAAMLRLKAKVVERFGAGATEALVQHFSAAPQRQESQRKTHTPGAQA